MWALKTFMKILGKALAFPQGRTKRLRPILFKSERAGWPQLMPELQFIRDPCEQIEIWNWSYWCQSVKRAVFIYQSPALLKINVPRELIDNWRDKGGKANVYIYIWNNLPLRSNFIELWCQLAGPRFWSNISVKVLCVCLGVGLTIKLVDFG